MTFALSSKRISSFVLSALFSSILLAGCTSAPPSNESVMVSAKGVKLESFMPADSFAMATLGTDDAGQKEMLGKLWANFPQDQAKEFIDKTIVELNKTLQEQGYSFDKDILPIVAGDQRVMVSISGQMSEEKAPKLVLAVPLTLAEKAQELLESEAGKGTYEKQSYKEGTIYVQKAGGTFITIQGDVLILTNQMDSLQQAIDNQNGANLLANVDYQKSIQGMPKGVMFLYLDVQRYLKTAIAMAQTAGVTQMQVDESAAGSFSSESIVVIAEADGFRLKGNILGSGEDSLFKALYGSSDAASKVPGKNVVLYVQGTNLARLIEMQGAMYKNMEGFSEIGQKIDAFFTMQGIDLSTEILAFMDKGYALVMGTSDGLMPWAGLYMDVSSQPEGAKKFMGFMYRGIDGLLTQAKEEPGLSQLIEHKKLDDKESQWYQVSVKLNEAPEFQTEEGKQIASEPISLKYGVGADNMSSILFAPDSVISGTSHLADDSLFKQMKGKLNGMEGSLTYVNVGLVADYFQKIVNFGVENGGNTSPEDIAAFNLVMTYVKPIKGMAFGAKALSDSQVQSEGFILIQK